MVMNARMEILLVKQLHVLFIISIFSLSPPGYAQEAPPIDVAHPEESVQIDEFGTVGLVVNETEVTQVLEMLAIQSQKNIIASNNVTGTVSANLYDVSFHEALNAILRVNGFGYIEEGNFVYVYTLEELETIEKALRQLKVVSMSFNIFQRLMQMNL